MEGHVRRAESKRDTHRCGLTMEVVVSLPLSPSELMNIRREIRAHGEESCDPMSQSCSIPRPRPRPQPRPRGVGEPRPGEGRDVPAAACSRELAGAFLNCPAGLFGSIQKGV